MELIGHSIPLDWHGFLMFLGLTGFWGDVKRQKNKNTGISPLWLQSAPPSVEMTLFFLGDKERTGDDKYSHRRKGKMWGFLPRRLCSGSA
jgi:hypothetical protein